MNRALKRKPEAEADFVGGRTIPRQKPYQPVQIDTKSGAYARMTAAGFRFEVGELGPSFSGTMTCVCGRQERFAVSRDFARNGKIDVAAMVENGGAASPHHLRQDGYSKEQIMAIRRAFV